MTRTTRLQLAGPEWQSPLSIGQSEADRGTLRAALLTTYEPPEASALIEDYLPQWLDLERGYTDESKMERCLFFVELDRRLKELHGRISVFCSPFTTAMRPSWLWRYIRLFPVIGFCEAPTHLPKRRRRSIFF